MLTRKAVVDHAIAFKNPERVPVWVGGEVYLHLLLVLSRHERQALRKEKPGSAAEEIAS